MKKIKAEYKGNGFYEFDFKGKVKDGTMLKTFFKKDKLFMKTIKNKQKFKKMKKSKETFNSLEQSIIEMIRFMETNPEKDKKEFKNEMELLEKNINEFAQRLNNFEAILKANKNTELEKIINKTCKGSIMNDFTTKQAKEAIMQAVLETLKNTKTEQVEKLKEFFNFKYEINETEQTEQNIEYYLNFTSKDAINAGQEAYNKQLIEIIEIIKKAASYGEKNITISLYDNLEHDQYIIEHLSKKGFDLHIILNSAYYNELKISW